MAWVKSEYAGELAVLSTWLVAVAPWSVSIFREGPLTAVVFRFLPFRIQYLYGVSISNELNFVWAWRAMQFPDNTGRAAVLWTLALAVVAVAVCASAYYYHREAEFTDRLPLHPVRFFGGLLGVGGLLVLVATVLLNLAGGFFGTTIPVGALVAPVLAAVLLTVDLT
ncbi:TIGR04206 family protein [Halomicroarcula sp. F28]|uniref:TIGR04206 family protein n=2 Tax=Haloarcula salinisoli TaxID=2487746 RepID=A0A8J8CC22_9EURY|nr:TIGR04206 family protein [Halomicroarcula salinisoli]MBX0302995.1 TIGR04206 family protein [Halomicroarcula salinisoli]